MIATIKPSSTKVETAYGDVRTLHYDKTWEQFEHLKKGFEGSRRVRLFYYDGTVEILMPGRAHEVFKGLIGFLIELFFISQTSRLFVDWIGNSRKSGTSLRRARRIL